MTSLLTPPQKLVRICGTCKETYDATSGPGPGCPKCGGGQPKVTRLEYFRIIMEQQKIYKNPRKYVILRNFNLIMDTDRDWELEFPPIGLVDKGDEFWTQQRTDEPDLIKVEVVQDRGPEGVFVTPVPRRHVEFLVDRTELHICAIPFRPKAIKRSELKNWIGETFANQIMERRAKPPERSPA